MSEFNPTPASTMTPSSTVAPKVTATEVQSDILTLNNTTVNNITHDPSNGDPNSLVTALGFTKTYNQLDHEIDLLVKKINSLEITPVLSEPMLPTNFIGNYWFLYNWYLDNGIAYYTNRNNIKNNNYLKIKTEAITEKGSYFIYMVVDRIDSGSLVITNEHGEQLTEVTLPGTVTLVTKIPDPSISYLQFEARNVNSNDSIAISNISLHHVKENFAHYLDYIVEHYESGGTGFASILLLNQEIEKIRSEYMEYTNSVSDNINTLLDIHKQDTTNPHVTTYSQVGAAPEVHYHNQYAEKDTVNQSLNTLKTTLEKSIEDRATEVLDTISGSIGTNLQDHIDDKDNPHDVTIEQIGAASIDHTHTPDEIGAANKVHTHAVADITNMSEIVMDIEENASKITDLTLQVAAHLTEFVGVSQKVNKVESNLNTTNTELDSLEESLNVHISDSNPHGTTANDIGLGNVVNASFATDQEAIDGVLTEKYMAPSTTRTTLEYFSNNHQYVAQTLTPKIISKIYLEPTEEDATTSIALNPEKIYQIHINSEGNGHINVNFTYNVVNTEEIFDNTLVATVLHSYIVNSSTSKGEYIPIDSTLSDISGILTLDMSTTSINGSLTGYTEDLDLSTIEIKARGLVRNSSISTATIAGISFSSNIYCTIKIYELVATNQDPAMVVDALPKGSIITRFGKIHIPGYSVLDGSKLQIEQHQDLLDYAISTGQVLESYIYEAEVESNGYCYSFGYSADEDYFYIPKDHASTDNTYRYIKIDDVIIPSSKQMVYRYVWS